MVRFQKMGFSSSFLSRSCRRRGKYCEVFLFTGAILPKMHFRALKAKNFFFLRSGPLASSLKFSRRKKGYFRHIPLSPAINKKVASVRELNLHLWPLFSSSFHFQRCRGQPIFRLLGPLNDAGGGREPLCNEEHVLRMNLLNEGGFSFEREREMKRKATARILSPFHCGGAENEVVVGGGISKTPDDE